MAAERNIFGSAATTADDMWAQVHERYTIIDNIAAGRDQTVIKKAQDKQTGFLVSLKVMPLKDEDRRESCRREAQILSSVTHRNVLAFHAAYESATEYVLVTEYCSGGDLLDRVNVGGKFSEDDARDYFVQLLNAVQYLNSMGIVHRDVKLDNIFIEHGQVKLGDFGFARHFFPGEKFTSSCGTLVYVAPELLVLKPSYDPLAAEVYSLGITLFAMCSAFLPYDSLDESQVIELVRRGGCSMPSHFSTALASLLQCMMDVSPSARPTLAEVRTSEWIVQSDRFVRTTSQPGMRVASIIETRPRAVSLPQAASSHANVNQHQQSHRQQRQQQQQQQRDDQLVVLAVPPRKKDSWFYRKFVRPITERISGGASNSNSRLDLSAGKLQAVHA